MSELRSDNQNVLLSNLGKFDLLKYKIVIYNEDDRYQIYIKIFKKETVVKNSVKLRVLKIRWT